MDLGSTAYLLALKVYRSVQGSGWCAKRAPKCSLLIDAPEQGSLASVLSFSDSTETYAMLLTKLQQAVCDDDFCISLMHTHLRRHFHCNLGIGCCKHHSTLINLPLFECAYTLEIPILHLTHSVRPACCARFPKKTGRTLPPSSSKDHGGVRIPLFSAAILAIFCWIPACTLKGPSPS
jgi:hypothetical protein